MIIRPPTSALRLRALAAATGLVLASTLLVPGAALAANGPPHPTTDTITTNEDTPASGNVLANDTNGGQGPLIVTSFTALSPAIGTLTIDADGNYSFTPAANWNGSTSTTYRVANNKHTVTGNININVLAVNDAPTANDDTVTATEDTATNVTAGLLANDTDADGDTLAVTAATNATGGTVGLLAGVVTFTPTADACGAAEGSFDYTVGDGHGGSDAAHATVNVTCVDDAPVATDDAKTGTEDADVVIVAADLATNDTDAEGDALTVTGVSNPTGGTVGLVAGTITFTPAADLCGPASAGFDYTVDDGNSGTDTGHVSIDLTCVNDAPVANDDTVNVEQDSTANDVTSAILANDTDTEGDTLTVTSADNATGGSVDATAGVVTFTPTADECGTGEGGFDYTIDDGNGGTDIGHVTVDVNCALNVAPVANDDTVPATEDTADVIAGGDLTGNDTDGNGDALTVSDVSNPTGGTVDVTAGTVTFTPTADLCGTGAGSFDYTVVDGNGGSDAGHVTVDITCVDDAPVANDDTVTVAQDSSANDVTSDLLGNDTDTEHDALVVSAVANATGGTADETAGVVTFTPAADVCGDGAGSFDYTVDDGAGGTDDGHVTVDITCTPNSAPVATDDAFSGTEDTDLVLTGVDLTGNDNDVDGDVLSVISLANPVGGTTALVAGTTTFTPDANVCGTGAGSFDYTVDDGHSGTDTGHVVIDLTCVNDAPVANDDAGGMVAKGSAGADYNVLANDTDVDGDSLTVTLVSVNPAQGTATIVGTGANTKVHFVPAAGFEGQAIITYTVSDGTLTDQGDLTVTVGPDVTAPIVGTPTVVFGSGRVNETAPLRINWLAFDPASGVASYRAQVSVGGKAFVTIYNGPATSVRKLLPFNKTLVFRVRATDHAGNVSGWKNSATRKIVGIQNGNKRVAYKAAAWTGVRLPASSGMGYSYSPNLHDRAAVSFIGRSVLYVAPKTRLSGHVKVYVDGTLVGRFNLHATTTRLGRVITMATWSTKGTHRIRIVNDNAGKRTNLDAFIVLK